MPIFAINLSKERIFINGVSHIFLGRILFFYEPYKKNSTFLRTSSLRKIKFFFQIRRLKRIVDFLPNITRMW